MVPSVVNIYLVMSGIECYDMAQKTAMVSTQHLQGYIFFKFLPYHFTTPLTFFPISCTHYYCSLINWFPNFNFGWIVSLPKKQGICKNIYSWTFNVLLLYRSCGNWSSLSGKVEMLMLLSSQEEMCYVFQKPKCRGAYTMCPRNGWSW